MGSSSSKQKRSPRTDTLKPPSISSGTGRKRSRKKRDGGDTASMASSGTESRRSSVSYVPNGKVHTGSGRHHTVEPLPNGQVDHYNPNLTNGHIPNGDGSLKRNHSPRENGGVNHKPPNGHVTHTPMEVTENHVTSIYVNNVPTDATDVDLESKTATVEFGSDYNGGGALPKTASSQNIFSRLKNNKKASILMLWEATRDDSRKKLSQLCDVAFLSSETLAISRGESGKAGLQLYSVQDGRPTGVLGEGFLKAPRGICPGPDGSIAVTDWEDKTVKFMDANGGFKGAWKTNKFKHPGGIAMNKDGRYIVPDITRGEAAIGLYSPYGKVLRRFGTKSLDWPWYVTVDRRNRILVSERKNGCINVFDDAGRFLFSFGAMESTDTTSRTSRSHDTTFNAPGGLTVDAQNNILVADTDNYRTSMFSPDGVFIKTLVTSTFSRPISVDYDDGLVAMVTDSDLRLYKTYMEKTSL